MESRGKFRYVDLFAGVGGFAAVMEALGGECEYAVEIDPAAAAVYRLNWGHDPLGDITRDADQDVMNVGPHDILTAGFPCQPFSKSGAQKGMDEVRGTLFFNIMRIIQDRKPTLVVLENVRNLTGPRHRHEWQVIIERLRAEGYHVSGDPAIFSPHQIDRKYGGRPHVRERVFITATLIPNGYEGPLNTDPLSLPPHIQKQGEWDLKYDLPLQQERHIPGTELRQDEQLWLHTWEEWVQQMWRLRKLDAQGADGPNVRGLPGFPIWVDAWRSKRWLDEQLSVAPKWKANFLVKNFELWQELRERVDSAWLDDWMKRVRKFPESRRKFEWQAQYADSIENCVIQFRPSGIRVKRPTHLGALVAITQTPVIAELGRRLSPLEAARMQGLPDSFSFGAQRDSATYKQMGNGVNVGVVWQVLKAHVERDREILEATESGRRIVEAVVTAPRSPDRLISELLEPTTSPRLQTPLGY